MQREALGQRELRRSARAAEALELRDRYGSGSPTVAEGNGCRGATAAGVLGQLECWGCGSTEAEGAIQLWEHYG